MATTATPTTTTKDALPPSPKGAFPLGHTLQYMRDQTGFLARAAREHGDVVRLRIGGMNVYAVFHPDAVTEVLKTNAASVVKDRFERMIIPVVGQGLLTSEGAFWRRQRKLAQPAFQREAVARYGAIMVEHAARLRETFRNGEARDVHEDMMELTLAIVAKTLFDAEVSSAAAEVGRSLDVIMAYYLNPLKFLPGRSLLPTRENRDFRRAVKQVDDVVFGIIRDRRASIAAGGGDPGDLLSFLLKAQDDEGRGMTDGQLRDECVTLFLAGHETTALTLTYSLRLLADNPAAAAALARELDDVLAGRPPTAADVPRLRYADWVVKESMRLYPPAWAMGREPVEDIEVGGYPVPKGTQLLVAQWVTHRDPRWFDDPDAFRPERWDNDLIRRLPKGAYFPFGDGPRVCVGNHFAMMEAILILATLTQNHRFEAASTDPLTTSPSITLRPKSGTTLTPRARQPAGSV